MKEHIGKSLSNKCGFLWETPFIVKLNVTNVSNYNHQVSDALIKLYSKTLQLSFENLVVLDRHLKMDITKGKNESPTSVNTF